VGKQFVVRPMPGKEPTLCGYIDAILVKILAKEQLAKE
jgi:hypothetical protein